MPNYSKNEIILVHYPFSDLSSSKVRPAVVVRAAMESYKAFSVDSPGVDFAIAIKDNYRVGKRSRDQLEL
jgi:hypothetical protein